MRRPYDMYILPSMLVALFVQGLIGILKELAIFKLSHVFSSVYLLFNYAIILVLLCLIITSAVLIFLGRNLGRLLYLILVILIFGGSILLNIDKLTLISAGIIFLISIWSLFRSESDRFFMQDGKQSRSQHARPHNM